VAENESIPGRHRRPHPKLEENRLASGVPYSLCMTDRRIVYVIRSRKDSTRQYIGRTADLPSRLASHNAGESLQTRNFAPWGIVVSVQFASEELASRFERFLKSGSGRAFTKQFFE
jgi:predicted GIY-YIG superfamily endonuclease